MRLKRKPYAETEETATKILVEGLTTRRLHELIPLAKSWLSPPSLQIDGEGYRSEGYDPTQRAYLLDAESNASETLWFSINATNESPLSGAAILIRNWGENAPSISIDARRVAWDKAFRRALIHRLDSTDLLVWIDQHSTIPVQIVLSKRKQWSVAR